MGDKPWIHAKPRRVIRKLPRSLALGVGVGQNAPKPGGSALWQIGYSADALRRFLSDERRQSRVKEYPSRFGVSESLLIGAW